MNNWSDIVPLIVILGVIVISVTRNAGKKSREETAKTTLPGRKSGEVKPFQKEVSRKEAQVSKPPIQAHPHTSSESSIPVFGEPDAENPIIDVGNAEELKRAVIYSEILNRKY